MLQWSLFTFPNTVCMGEDVERKGLTYLLLFFSSETDFQEPAQFDSKSAMSLDVMKKT